MIAQLPLLTLAFAWAPSEIDALDFDEVHYYGELAKLRLKRML